MPSHNSEAANYKQLANGSYEITGVTSNKGGVYDNYVAYNTANANGTGGYKSNAAGSGAGILLASAGAVTAVYVNTIAHNEASKNGLAGITIYAHYTGGEDLQGHKLLDNTIGENNVKRDALDTPYTGADYSTTGILLYSAMPITVTVSGNHIRDDRDGLWKTANVTVSTTVANTFKAVAHHLYIDHDPFGSALAVQSVTSTSATLIGFAVPNGAPASAYFHWFRRLAPS